MIGRSLLILMAAGAAFAASDPSVDGPFASARQTVGIPGTQNATLTTDVYFPGTTATGVDPSAGPCPVIVLGHGFSQSRSQHVNQGLQLATRGYIVLIPSFN
jgi:predicted dienelactone hydrolase